MAVPWTDQEGGEELRPSRWDAVRRLPLWLRVRCGLEIKSLVALGVVLLVAAALAVHHLWSGRAEPVAAPVPETGGAASAGPPTQAGGIPASVGSAGAGAAGTPGAVAGVSAGGAASTELLVDVAGEVRRPGVHRLPAGARVADALKAAGGVRPGVTVEGLNRARRVADGEQIVVAEGAGPAAGPEPGDGGVAGAASGDSATPVSLNTATAEQLETLPGVGPVLARQIIDHRTSGGGFTSVDQLREVSGIGDHRFATLRPLVTP